MSLSEEIPECPLCLEPFALDDINFYPCACRYQICRFCWHRIRTDENGLCPHCREPYSENPAEYTPPSQDQLAKLKHSKKQKSQDKKQKLVESRKNLSSLRVVQKNLVFVIGLSPRLAEPDILRKNEYFGKYGKIYKVVINNSTVYNGAQGPSVSAYVTYYREEDASKAIQAVNNAFIDGRYLKASYGTTKYCTYFLRGSQCTKPDCMYLHEIGDEEASFTKEDMQAGKHQVFENLTLAASNIPQGERELGGQSSVRRQESLLKGKEIDVESALPATASWATRQASGQAVPGPQSSSHSKDTKPQSNKDSKHHSSGGRAQQNPHPPHRSHSHPAQSHPQRQTSLHSVGKSESQKSGDQSEKPASSRSFRSGPLSPHSTGSAGSESGTARRHHSMGNRSDQSTHSGSTSRSSSAAASGSSKSVSPNLSPKSSLSTSSSSGSLKQDGEGRGGGGGGGQKKGSEKERDRENTRNVEVDVTFGAKPHPLEAVSRQLDPIDLDDDWGLQEVRAASTIDATGHLVDAIRRDSSEHDRVAQGERGRERPDAVDVISSLGSAGSGQFGSLGVSWNAGAPPLRNSPSPPPPAQYSALGGQSMMHNPQQMERKQLQEDDLGFDPWDISKRGLADLLETEGKPSYQHTPAVGMVNGVGRRGEGDSGKHTTPTVPATMETTNLSWQEELKTVFPNVNISFGGPRPSSTIGSHLGSIGSPPNSTSSPSTTHTYTPSLPLHTTAAPSTAGPSSTLQTQTPLQQALNGAHSAYPYQATGTGTGIGSLFGYSSPLSSSLSDYQGLFNNKPSQSRASAKSAFEAPNHTFGTATTSIASTTSGDASVLNQSNATEWPDLSASAVGSNRGGKAGGSGVVSSGVSGWNGSMGNGSVGNGSMGESSVGNGTAVTGDGRSSSSTASKDASSGPVQPPPGFTSRSKDTSLSSSINHALWNNATGKGQATIATPNPLMTSQVLQNWAKYLQMNFGGLTPQQLAANPLYQQMVRQQQQYWALLRQQQILQIQQAQAAAGRGGLTPAQLQQLSGRVALSQAQLQQLQQLQQQQQQARTAMGSIPVTAVPQSGQSVSGLGQAVHVGHPQTALLKSASQQGSTNRSSQSQKVSTK